MNIEQILAYKPELAPHAQNVWVSSRPHMAKVQEIRSALARDKQVLIVTRSDEWNKIWEELYPKIRAIDQSSEVKGLKRRGRKFVLEEAVDGDDLVALITYEEI